MARLAKEPWRELNPATGFLGGAGQSLGAIWKRRELVVMLFKREIRSRYKDSALGVVWSLVRPLTMLAVYYFVLGSILGARRSIPDFSVYIYTGLTLWSLFNESVTTGTQSILTNGGIIKKIHLPREVFPLASVGSALFNFVIQFVILLVAAFTLGGGINTHVSFLYLPLSLAVIIVWSTALALVLSAVNVYLRDVQFLVEVVLMIGFWASPVVYSWQLVNDAFPNGSALLEAYISNPITLAIFGAQRVIWLGGADMIYPSHLALRLGVALLVGLIGLFAAQRAFNRLQRNFAQEI
jgi:ABC-2 type transport system permease protein